MKNMKIRKIVLLPIILLLLGIFTASIVFAAESRTFGIVSIREGGYGYQANTKNVWKIVEYEGNNFTYDNAIYCLKAGQGFGDNAHIEKREYNISYDMKQYSTIPDSIKGILPSLKQLETIYNNKSSLETLLSSNGGKKFSTDHHYWSSTGYVDYSGGSYYLMNMGDGYEDRFDHADYHDQYVRPVLTSW